MVDRARKGMAIRSERQRRRPFAATDTAVPSATAARPSLVTGTSSVVPSKLLPAPTSAATKAGPSTVRFGGKISVPSITIPKPASSSTEKKGRGRPAASILTASSLLSLHYSADQLDATSFLANKAALPAASSHFPHPHVRVAASTAALMAKGVGATTQKMTMSTQLRLRHPHPDSLGGQRRASAWNTASSPAVGGNDSNNDASGSAPQPPFSEAFLKQTLPPLPTVRDRLDRQPLDVLSPEQARTTRAQAAVRKVLKPFEKPMFSKQGRQLGDVTKIRVLHNLWKLGNEAQATEETESNESGSSSESSPTTVSSEPEANAPLDPVVAFLVLHSAGFIGRTQRDKKVGELKSRFPELGADLGSEELEKLRQRILGNSETSFTDSLYSNKRPRDNDEASSEQQGKRSKKEEPPPLSTTEVENPGPATGVDGVPVMGIRGGGEAPTESNASLAEKGDESTGSVDESKAALPSQSPAESPSRPLNASVNSSSSTSGMNPSLPGYMTPSERLTPSSAISTLQLAHQLRQGTFHHSSGETPAGSLPYLVQHPPREGFDLSTLVGTAGLQGAHPSLSALNYARQNQAVAEARAHLFAREQQAAALLRGAAFSQHGHAYTQGGPTHPAALAALLGNPSHAALVSGGQYAIALTGHVGGMQQPQPLYQSPGKQSNTLSSIPSGSSVDQTKHRGDTGTSEGDDLVSDSPSSPEKSNPGEPQSQSASADNGERQDREASKQAAQSLQAEPDNKQSTGSLETKAEERRKNEENTDQTKVENPVPLPPAKENATAKAASGITSTGENGTLPRKEKGPSDAPTSVPIETARERVGHSSAKQTDIRPVSTKVNDGMKFVLPPTPSFLSRQDCDGVRAGRFHEVAERHSDPKALQGALKYLVDCGNAVPIPRALIFNPLRERLNTPGIKTNPSNSLPPIPKDIVAYTVLVWLWSNHEIAFRDAFEKSGRIDVDPDCKWLINAAIDTSIRELTSEIAQERAMSQGPFGASSTGTEKPDTFAMLEIHTAKIVCRSLMTELRVLQHANLTTSNFQDLVEYLDETRLCALRGKTQERALLANLLARKCNVSEPFSHAYTSSMVRAGEAFGHESVLEMVQDETEQTSSLLPYDICADDMGEWEDPCRPSNGYVQNLTAVELRRKAHALAMIQRSLKKLQDRHSIKGGVLRQGPLSDYATSGVGSSGSRTPTSSGSRGYKRKHSGFSEPPPPPGTGSAPALNWAAYEPRHFSAPIEWDSSAVQNTPYGQHDNQERPRSLSLSFSARTESGKKARRTMSFSAALAAAPKSQLQRSTCEIPWVEVAGIFQKLELPKKSPPKSSSSQHDHHASVPVPAGSVIVAPYCREIQGGSFAPEPTSEGESDTEENLSDEYVISQHEAVLDVMKKKLSAYMEARQKQNEKKRGRPSGSRG